MARQIVFLYAPQDEALAPALDAHLAPVKREGLLTTWHEGQLPAGASREHELSERLRAADLVLPFLSADFLSCALRVDLLQRLAQAGRPPIVPVVVRPCDFRELPWLAARAQLPRGALAVSQWVNQDEAWLAVARGVWGGWGGLAPLTVKVWVQGAREAPPRTRDIWLMAREQRGASFAIGDEIRVGVQADRDCHVMLINVGSSGRASQIYPGPDALGRTVRVVGDSTAWFPQSGDRFMLGGPAGRERVRALASVDAALLDGVAMAQVLGGACPAGWVEASCEFTVCDRGAGKG